MLVVAHDAEVQSPDAENNLSKFPLLLPIFIQFPFQLRLQMDIFLCVVVDAFLELLYLGVVLHDLLLSVLLQQQSRSIFVLFL